MSVIEKFATISQVLTKLMNAIGDNQELIEALKEFANGLPDFKEGDIINEDIIFNFVFNGRVSPQKISIIDFFLIQKNGFTTEEKEILVALKTSMNTVFEIKKILKTGFNLYCLTDEREYTVMPLVKMSHLRGLYVGNYITANIFSYENEYYLIEISDVYSPQSKRDVYKLATAMLVDYPELYYENDKKRIKKIEKSISDLYNKFVNCFGSDEIITMNTCVDDLILLFEKYCEDKVSEKEIAETIAKIEKPTEFGYKEIEDLNTVYDDFLEKSLSGFASHNENYDVAVIFDKEFGLYIIPFYATLLKIFASGTTDLIAGQKECLLNFLNNNSIPPIIINRILHLYPNFMKRVNEILETNYTLDEMLQIYKYRHLETKIFSSMSILNESKVFSETLEMLPLDEGDGIDEITPIDYNNVGRNDPCPCGSGKKFKKCCGKQ